MRRTKKIALLRGNKGQTEIVVLLVIIVIASLVGLYHADKQARENMRSWIGRHQSELIASWGPPDRTFVDHEGRTSLVYTYYSESRRGPLGRWPVGHEVRTSIVETFYVDSQGVIYDFYYSSK